MELLLRYSASDLPTSKLSLQGLLDLCKRINIRWCDCIEHLSIDREMFDDLLAAVLLDKPINESGRHLLVRAILPNQSLRSVQQWVIFTFVSTCCLYVLVSTVNLAETPSGPVENDRGAVRKQGRYQTYKNSHVIPDLAVNGTPCPTIHNSILPKLTRRRQCLERKIHKSMIPRGIRMCPRRLADRRPDPRLGDIGGGLVIS